MSDFASNTVSHVQITLLSKFNIGLASNSIQLTIH